MPFYVDENALAEALHELAEMVRSKQVVMLDMSVDVDTDVHVATSWTGRTYSIPGFTRQTMTMRFQLLHGSKMEAAMKKPPALPSPQKKLPRRG